MILSKVALMAIRGSSHEFKQTLAKALGISGKTLYRYLLNNHDNLTKAAAMELIKIETGLSDEQILENVEVEKV